LQPRCNPRSNHAAAPLTAKLVENISPEPVRFDLADTVVRGLRLRVTPNGVKTWAVWYRNDAGIGRRLTLGRYPDLGLAEARREARAALRKSDPQAERIARRKADREAHERAATAPTFGGMLDAFWHDIDAGRYRKARGNRPLRQATIDAWSMLTRAEVRPRLGHVRLEDVTAVLVRDHLEQIAETRPYLSNRALELIQRVYTWSIERERVLASPVAGMRPIGVERTRDRVLSDDEIQRVWPTLEGSTFGAALQMLFWTGARRSEVFGMTWGEIDFSGAVWRLSATRTKQDKAHAVPLAPQALALLQIRRPEDRAPDAEAPVFTTDGRRGLVSAQRFMREVVAKSGVSFRIHDIRRTAATRMVELGVLPAIVDCILGHAQGQVTATYIRHLPLVEMRRALQIWASHLDTLVANAGRKLLVFPHAAR
jgi:integrase